MKMCINSFVGTKPMVENSSVGYKISNVGYQSAASSQLDCEIREFEISPFIRVHLV